MNREFWKKITYIEHELSSAGYDPYAQLSAYIETGDTRYITRQGNARQLILELDTDMLAAYLMQKLPE